MEYHDNQVDFESFYDTLYYLTGIKFVPQDLMVTAGQDPKHLFTSQIGVEQSVEAVRQTATLTYTLGRKGSADVANWWKQRFSDSDTTFNSHPDQLNFAMIGTLSLAYQGPDMANEKWLRFDNIGMAQGHNSNGNNWWFAHQGGVHNGGASGRDEAIRMEDSGVSVCMYRGAIYNPGATEVSRCGPYGEKVAKDVKVKNDINKIMIGIEVATA